MRIFRTRDAARKAMLLPAPGNWVLLQHFPHHVLTDQERLMFEALEANARAFREAKNIAAFWSDALLCQQAAERTEALIKELNVEG